jgi:hypothetical protein
MTRGFYYCKLDVMGNCASLSHEIDAFNSKEKENHVLYFDIASHEHDECILSDFVMIQSTCLLIWLASV